MLTFIQRLRQIPFRGYVYVSFGLSLATAFFILVMQSYLPPEVPLFYGRTVGPEQLVSKLEFIIPPGVSALITSTNALISTLISDDFLRKILAISSFVVSLLVTITILKISFLVGFF